MENESKKINVILLKTSDQSAKTVKDKYIEHLTNSDVSQKFKSVSQINLLQFEFCNLSAIHDNLADFLLSKNDEIITKFLQTKYRSLILTSRQTVESIEAAFERELEQVKGSNNHTALLEDSLLQNLDLNESKLFVYCVGQATFSRFKEMLRRFKSLNESVDKNVCIRSVSEGKQNALELSRLIIQDKNNLFSKNGSISDDSSLQFAFYPCSSIRKDDLSIELNKNGVSFEEVTAYKTLHSESGLKELHETLLSHLYDDTFNFLVFFSPSGCDAVFEESIEPNKLGDLVRKNLDNVRLLSIGPSTSAKLKLYFPDSFGKFIFELDEPSPRALLDKLNSF
jgi:uroporphyrinogen-III synthase